MSVIRVACTDQVLAFENTPVIASGGIEENFVQFTFCSAWDGFEKTAVFWRSEAEAYHNMLDESNSCQLPPEVTGDEGVIYFGVFGVNAAGCRRTSNVLSYRIDKGAITIETQPSDPTPDIYTQLLAKYNEMIDIAEDTRAKEQAFEEAMTQRMGTHEADVAADQAAFEETMTKKQADHEAAVDADQKAFEEAMAAAQETFETHIEELIAAGLLPDDSVATEKIKNGAITTPKLADGAVTAAKLAPGVMADAYTKTETLTDATKTAFGLGADAAPDDVFGLFVEHSWTAEEQIINKAYGSSFEANVVSGASSTSTTTTITYASDLAADGDGNVSLKDPKTVSVSYNTYTNANVLKGKFWLEKQGNTFDLVWTPADAADASRRANQGGSFVSISAQKVTTSIGWDEPILVSSRDRNAYPDSGIANGFRYAYSGTPIENAKHGGKFVMGSYVGAGVYGSGNPTTLNFDIMPKCVIVYYAPLNNDHRLAVFIRGVNRVFNYSGYGSTASTAELHVTWGEKSLSWYSQTGNGSDVKQMNASGCTGYYIAWGN